MITVWLRTVYLFLLQQSVTWLFLGGGAPLLLYLHIILVGRSHSFPSDPGLAYLGQVPYLLGHHGSSKNKHMTLIVLSWDSCCKDLEQEHTMAGPLSEQGASIVTVNEQSAKEANAWKETRETHSDLKTPNPWVKPRLESPSEFSFAQGPLSAFNRKVSTSDTRRAWQWDKYILDTKYKEGYFRFLKIVFTTVCLCGIMLK